jgi:uncharacterized membrane protein YhaH (DUF805 family)
MVSAGCYSGRSCRREFWTFTLASAFVAGCLAGAARALGRPGGPSVLAVTALVIFIVVVAFPWLALAVRRLHDTGRPGHYLLLAYVPFGLIALIWFFAQPGNPGGNQFGPLPGNAHAL